MARQIEVHSRPVFIARQQSLRRRIALRNHVRGGSGCNAMTVRCPDARDMHQETAECCKGHVRQIMQDLAQLMDAAGITWWADYGTVLGYVRHGGMIPWDKDGDLGVLGEDRDKLLSLFPILVKKGYWPRYSQPKTNRFRSGDRVKVCLSQRNHTNVDLFIWYRRPGKMLDRLNYIAADMYKGREMPQSWILPTRRGEWDGIDIAIPAKPEKLAEHRYGPDYMTPLHEKHPRKIRP
jgi:hypothetical protein